MGSVVTIAIDNIGLLRGGLPSVHERCLYLSCRKDGVLYLILTFRYCDEYIAEAQKCFRLSSFERLG